MTGMPQGKKKGLSTKKFDRCVTEELRIHTLSAMLVWVVNQNRSLNLGQIANVRVVHNSNSSFFKSFSNTRQIVKYKKSCVWNKK